MDISIDNNDITYINYFTQEVFKEESPSDQQLAFVRSVCHCLLDGTHETTNAEQHYIVTKMEEFLVSILLLRTHSYGYNSRSKNLLCY